MKLFRNQSGQGMTEYIIIVALVAIAAIGAFAYFGKTVRTQTAAMSESMAGNEQAASQDTTEAGKAAGKATTAAQKDKNLSDYVDDSAAGK